MALNTDHMKKRLGCVSVLTSTTAKDVITLTVTDSLLTDVGLVLKVGVGQCEERIINRMRDYRSLVNRAILGWIYRAKAMFTDTQYE